MNILSNETYTIESSLHIKAVTILLQQTIKPLQFTPFPQLLETGQFPLVGQVNEKGFSATTFMDRSWGIPMIKGEFLSNEKGTIINISKRIHPVILLFWGGTICFTILLGIISLICGVFGGVLFALIMTGGIALLTALYISQQRATEDRILKILGHKKRINTKNSEQTVSG